MTSHARPRWRTALHEVIAEAETPLGRLFDILLIVAILASVAVVMLESEPSIQAVHGSTLRGLEWGFTALFTVEYILRLLAADRPGRYARSFFGIVDLVAVLPTWIALFIPGAQAFLVIRILRVLRVFRILKLAVYVGEARILTTALRNARYKITIFIVAVLSIVSVVGSLMYVVEGPDAGFTNIPLGVYWAVVTLTTVGYGDLVPLTAVGKTLATSIMVLGYGVIAIPTGILSVEIANAQRIGARSTTEVCQSCGREGHDRDALHCKWCGTSLGATGEPGAGGGGTSAGTGRTGADAGRSVAAAPGGPDGR